MPHDALRTLESVRKQDIERAQRELAAAHEALGAHEAAVRELAARIHAQEALVRAARQAPLVGLDVQALRWSEDHAHALGGERIQLAQRMTSLVSKGAELTERVRAAERALVDAEVARRAVERDIEQRERVRALARERSEEEEAEELHRGRARADVGRAK